MFVLSFWLPFSPLLLIFYVSHSHDSLFPPPPPVSCALLRQDNEQRVSWDLSQVSLTTERNTRTGIRERPTQIVRPSDILVLEHLMSRTLTSCTDASIKIASAKIRLTDSDRSEMSPKLNDNALPGLS